MEITKIQPRIYTYELKLAKEDEEYGICTWARFVFDCDHGCLTINSDAGNYSYSWGYNEHEDFMHLMSRIRKDYLLDKIACRSIFLLEKSKKETIHVIEENGWDCFGIASEEKWKEIKKDILDIDTNSEAVFYNTVSDLIPNICWENVMIETDYPRGAKVIAAIFDKYLQPIIKKEFSFTQ